MKRLTISTSIAMGVLLAGCSTVYPPVNQTVRNDISAELRSAVKPTPAPVASLAKPTPDVVSNLLLPPVNAPAPGHGPEQRFDLVVSDAPIGQVLSGLVAGTDYSILLKAADQPPTMPNGESKAAPTDPSTRRVTLNLKNVTLYESLDSLRDLYGYDYSVTGRRILVQPESIQSRVYFVNYVSGQRRGVSDMQVVGGVSAGSTSSSGTASAATGTSSSTSGSSYSSVQASGLSTSVKSDVWGEAEEALRTLLACQLVKTSGVAGSVSGATGASGAAGITANTAGRVGASRADLTFPGQQPIRERYAGAEGCPDGRAVTVNQMSGLILVRGMPNELRMAEKLLRSMQINVTRQVIIEAKIIDVELNSGAQQGINWSVFNQGTQRFSVGGSSSNVLMNQAARTANTLDASVAIGSANVGGGGALVSETVSLGALLGSGLPSTAGLTSGMGMAVQARNFAALIQFLETQGRVHVLSSPRISTLNNQKSVIKVGSEEPFVTSINSGTATATVGTPVLTEATLNYQPFFSGIALDVTPQIDADDNITLHVHSMVNNVVEKQKIALPRMGADTQLVPFASNTINETDSVVRARDGQVIVIGGLMTESSSDNRGGIPGARDVPGLGALFNRGAQSMTKRELVILLKPTIVKSDAAWVSDITATGERIGAMDIRR